VSDLYPTLHVTLSLSKMYPNWCDSHLLLRRRNNMPRIGCA
jgi:hypothetical protein